MTVYVVAFPRDRSRFRYRTDNCWGFEVGEFEVGECQVEVEEVELEVVGEMVRHE